MYKLLAIGEQSCAQGFQSWDTVDATSRTGRNRQHISPTLNFLCDGVIRSWVLKRYRRVRAGETIALQLWRQKAGTESIYTLQTEQKHTAATENAPSYAFTASPPMTVTAGDVFGFYVPSGDGLRMAFVSDIEHTMFIVQTAAPTEIKVTASGSSISPLITIEFSKSLQHKMITC